ncbi:MAG: zinc ribbon domain-containing protein [Clostridia bacterium]|nr:zinc ribbon domain-containing protein [Clostridia bacterium]
MFCPNCGTQLAGGVNFCPNCGTRVNDIARTVAATDVNQGNTLMLLSLGTCARTTAAALLQQLCGYAPDEALLIVDSMPIKVARGLTDAQARYLAQAFSEYGLEVAVYDRNGWREWESDNDSVWDNAGSLIATVASALGLMSLNNRISRDMMHRMDYPYRYTGTRPPVYRLNNRLRAVPVRRVAPVRPPVHHAAPPIPRPAPKPSARSVAGSRPMPVHPAPSRPAPTGPVATPRPAPGPHGNGRPGGTGRGGQGGLMGGPGGGRRG